MEYLLNVTAKYRVATVEDAQELHDRLKNDSRFELIGFNRVTKYIKAKGEIIGEYQVVTVKLEFTTEKDPEITYELDFVKE